MTDERMVLSRNVEGLEKILSGDVPLMFLGGDKRGELFLAVREIRKKLESLGDNILTVGLMGGTGVGKSSVMNALAREYIASTSHRRPHTDAVLVYRHSAVPPPELTEDASLPRCEYVHEAEEVRHVVLCDLPDYDSVNEAHRGTVMALLDVLDMLIWVISPEKYADGQLYDFLQLLPKDRGNCYFVLNKTDLFFRDGISASAHERLVTVLGSLTSHLGNIGISEPVLYHVSATEAFEGIGLSAWNQFPLLRRELFRTRDIKEIRRIKAANIHAELEPVLRALEMERHNLDDLGGMIPAGSTMTGEERKRVLDDIYIAAAPWVEVFAKQYLADNLAAGRDLVGPGRIISALAGRLKGAAIGDHEKIIAARRQAVEHISNTLARHLTARGERLRSDLYRRFERSELPDELACSLDTAPVRAVFETGLARLFTGQGRETGKIFGPLYTFRQHLAYALLLVIFLLVLPGEHAWKSFFDHPGFFSALGTLALMALSLFSSRGLAALASLILISFYMGWHFYKRSDRMIALAAQGLADIMKEELNRLVHEAINERGAEMERLQENIRSSLTALDEVLKGQRYAAPAER
ncbi:MAG: 50S ribosome-binding GTPase [Syntrophales bacterium]|jgi:hypothetical protein|nr:50S ribosome-binding GTPase [Syntrophales bacterium]MCK9528220.1 50S ribosome-binding GTPase [Syntrophales bacterium]MDX9921368.1 GTPase [Syntrophales bacterium]